MRRRKLLAAIGLGSLIGVPTATASAAAGVQAGPVGDGVADDTAALQALIDSAAGTLTVPPGRYRITGTLTVAAPLVLTGYGATLVLADPVNLPALAITSSGVQVHGMAFEGSADEVYRTLNRAIRVAGPSSTAMISGVTLRDCVIDGFNGAGISLTMLDGFLVENCTVRACVYAGIMALSVRNGRVTGNHVATVIQPDLHSYGISLSQSKSGGGPNATYPACRDVMVDHNFVSGVPWEALDTHSGIRVTFAYNHIRGCGTGIGITCVDSEPDYGAPQFCSAIGNTIAESTSGEKSAISVNGAEANPGRVLVEYAEGILIANNNISGYPGGNNAPTIGAIRFRHTRGLQVTDNTIFQPGENGVLSWYSNYGFLIAGNTVVDPHQPTGATASAVRILGPDSSGLVSDVNLVRGDKQAAHVGRFAVRIDDASSEVYLGGGFRPVDVAGQTVVGAPAGPNSRTSFEGRQLGFYGVEPVNRQQVAGANTDARLSSLITALERQGLIYQ